MTSLDLVSYAIILGQIPSGAVSTGGFSAPTGMTITGFGTTLKVAAGSVFADGIQYKLEEDYTKNLTQLFDVGSGSGALLYGDTLEDGKWYVYATSTGSSTDILVSKSLTPLWPAETPIPVEEVDFYSPAAFKFKTGYRIGHFIVEEGLVTSTYPTEDLATAFIDDHLVSRAEFDAYKAQMAQTVASLDERVTVLENTAGITYDVID